jgi:hypothetical protein
MYNVRGAFHECEKDKTTENDGKQTHKEASAINSQASIFMSLKSIRISF